MSGSLRFHERMAGWISFDEHSYNQAVSTGHRDENSCAYSLEIEIDDLDRFFEVPSHTARVEGSVQCDALGGELTVQQGSTFNLFVDVGGERHKRMLYRLFLTDRDGRQLTLSGFKDLEHGPTLDIWANTTRLFVRLLAAASPQSPKATS